MSTTYELQPLPAAALRSSVPHFEPLSPDSRSRPASPAPSTSSRRTLELNPGTSLAPVDGGKDAWIFLAAATGLEVLVWGLPFSVGVLHTYWVTELFKNDHGAEATLTLAATLQTGLMYLSCIFFSPLLARFPQYRWHMQVVGLSCAVIGLIGSGFATKPSHILILIGLIYPVCCVMYLPGIILLFEWWQEKRGFASGIMYAGTGAGGTLFPFIMQGLLSRFSYKASMCALGVGFAIFGIISILGIKPRIPIARSGASAKQRRARTNWTFLRKSSFYAFTAAITLTSLGNFIPSIFLPSYAAVIDSKPNGTTLVALMNAASVPGLLVWGYLSDRVPTRIVVGICAFAAALSLIFCWGFAGQNSAPLVAFAVLWGLTGLSFTSLWSKLITIVSDGDPTLPSLILSIFAFARGCGNIASGPISSSLLKSSLFEGGRGSYGLHGYGSTLLYAGLMNLAGAVSVVLYRTPKKKP